MGETIRVEHFKDYTIISNLAIRDVRLSLRARGLHHLLLSYPNGWKINIDHLTGESKIEGKDAIAKSPNFFISINRNFNNIMDFVIRGARWVF
jgi:hypothetical protein